MAEAIGSCGNIISASIELFCRKRNHIYGI